METVMRERYADSNIPTALFFRRLRERAGLTQAELARRAACSYQALRVIENGFVRVPRVETLVRLAKAYGVPFPALRQALRAARLEGADPEAVADAFADRYFGQTDHETGELIVRLIATGRYRSQADVLAAAVRLLAEREGVLDGMARQTV